uniref:Uncharacterized protein n=1 Tax=Glossina austeni TaxID=7395 RepID=A0A1A9UR88_GLOAU
MFSNSKLEAVLNERNFSSYKKNAGGSSFRLSANGPHNKSKCKYNRFGIYGTYLEFFCSLLDNRRAQGMLIKGLASHSSQGEQIGLDFYRSARASLAKFYKLILINGCYGGIVVICGQYFCIAIAVTLSSSVKKLPSFANQHRFGIYGTYLEFFCSLLDNVQSHLLTPLGGKLRFTNDCDLVYDG